MAAVTKPGPATPGVFDLTDEHEVALAERKSRPGAPSPFLDGLREAYQTQAQRGVKLVETDEKKLASENRKVCNQLRRAAEQLSQELGKTIKVSAQTRYNHPKLGSFVAFTAKDAD